MQKVFTGFFTDNYQARVNSLSYGLDNWVYGANGLLGGIIHGAPVATTAQPLKWIFAGAIFGCNPDTGVSSRQRSDSARTGAR